MHHNTFSIKKKISEPPTLKSVTEEKLRLFVKQKEEVPLLRLPCHTQVERAIEAVTEA